eukprot:TRINITY_DN10041_c0_g1_i1.p1 TRINITY_DN10041_c0_g1~~TRINITY_DN10041_c0_g1_i1.p1  ORF type:complete len:244 (+),score=42.53 TRINITY_DN10041_c0_g1_i1:371-1102(+)
MERTNRPAPDNDLCSGAGVLPYTIHDGKLLFLFHKTYSGKKQGSLIDFGGAVDQKDGLDPLLAASREFIEETFACSICNHSLEELKVIAAALTTETALQQSEFVQYHIKDFYQRLKVQYENTSARTSHIIQSSDRMSWPLALRSEASGPWNGSFDRYFMFFCFVDWKPAAEMTQLFHSLSTAGPSASKDAATKTKLSVKMRSFEWVASDHILRDNPDPPLFSRVANIHNLKEYVIRIGNASPK